MPDCGDGVKGGNALPLPRPTRDGPQAGPQAEGCACLIGRGRERALHLDTTREGSPSSCEPAYDAQTGRAVTRVTVGRRYVILEATA